MHLQNKKIAILGFGAEGQSLFKYLKEHNCQDITVCDKNRHIQLPKLSKACLGKNYLKDLKQFDIIFRSPGISPNLPQLKKAQKAEVELTSSPQLFFDLCKAKIIGITGTKGKGTTATLIYKILQAWRENLKFQPKPKIYLAGNIGKSPLDFVDRLKSRDIVILELSSFQLQDLRSSPEIAVILNITSDHLDYHKSVSEYRQAKGNIVRYQRLQDKVVINQDYAIVRRIGDSSKAKKYYFSLKQEVVPGACLIDDKIVLRINKANYEICQNSNLKLNGRHNLENALAAVTASALIANNYNQAQFRKVLKSSLLKFKALEHRLEYVREINEVKYYNDSASTNPETAIAAIRSFCAPIVLVLGGSDKGLKYDKLACEITQNPVKAVVLIGQTASQIEQALLKAGFCDKIVLSLKTMNKIVVQASRLAQKGDIVLLSPGCASFDMFENYQERGDLFKKVVNEMKPGYPALSEERAG